MTNEDQALTIVERAGLPAQTFDAKDVALLRDLVAKDLSSSEFGLFIKVCETTGLSPFAKQIYAIKRGQGDRGRMTIQTGIDGFRLIAQRSGEYGGQIGPLWCGSDGEWSDIWVGDNHPFAAKVGVMRSGFTEPLWATAFWKGTAQYFNQKLGEMWEKMPAHMLAKCAEAQALRKAFPQELSALYTSDEMPPASRRPRTAVRPTELPEATEAAQEAAEPPGTAQPAKKPTKAAPVGDRPAFDKWCATQQLTKTGQAEKYLGLTMTGDDPIQSEWIDPMNEAGYTTAEALEEAQNAISAVLAEAVKLQKAKDPDPLTKALGAVAPLGYRDRAIAERKPAEPGEAPPDDGE